MALYIFVLCVCVSVFTCVCLCVSSFVTVVYVSMCMVYLSICTMYMDLYIPMHVSEHICLCACVYVLCAPCSYVSIFQHLKACLHGCGIVGGGGFWEDGRK